MPKTMSPISYQVINITWLNVIIVKEYLNSFISLCNTFAPKIKGIQRVTYLVSPWFEDNIFDVALVQRQHCDAALALGRLC